MDGEIGRPVAPPAGGCAGWFLCYRRRETPSNQNNARRNRE